MRPWPALRAAVLGALLLLLAVPVVFAASPAQAEPSGWQPVFATDFAGPGLPAGCEAYDGPQGGVAANYYRPDDVTVSGGLLHLTMRERAYGGRPFTSGGLGCRRTSQTYGRYEFRAKAPAGAGIDAYVTLWPESGNRKDATLIEILTPPGAEKMYLTNEYGSGSSQVTVPGAYSDGFHTYVIEWAPDSLRILVDGRQRMNDPHVSLRDKWIGFAVSSGDQLTGVPDAATPLPADFQIDWLRVYSYAPSGVAGGPVRRGSVSASGTAAGTAGRMLAMAFTACAAAAAIVLLTLSYLRLRARRRLRPAHRA
jgi:beta-glucanase (GH16 family)